MDYSDDSTSRPFRVRSGLSRGQLLQRGKDGASVTVTGDAPGTGDILASVTLAGESLAGFSAVKAGRASGGSFTARLRALPPGGPYEVTFECRYARGAVALATVSDVWVGDLWLLAGQSNMEGIGVIDRDAPTDGRIRCLTMARVWETARDPIHFLAESPDAVHNGGARLSPHEAAAAKRKALRGSGPGFWFALEMLRRTGVPQGLIATAHGGTSMDQWSPELADRGGNSLYGSMLASLRASGQPLAGALWYQGCSDTYDDRTGTYTEKMKALVEAVRRDTGQPRLPWIIAQIARELGREAGHDAWASITEQQRVLPAVIPRLEMVPTADLEMDDWIHISTPGHRILAGRFADMAERLVFGRKDILPCPQPVSARFVKDPLSPVVEVAFKNVVGGLSSPCRPTGFAIRTPTGRILKAVYQTRYSGNKARLRLTMDELVGCSVVHGWGCDPEVNTFDSRQMPVPSFGPIPIEAIPPLSRWFRVWEASSLAKGEDIAGLPCPARDAYGRLKRLEFPDWWKANMEETWRGKSGHTAFFASFELSEAAECEALVGYDGPFRLWIDGKEAHKGLSGPWPRDQDSLAIPLRLAAGRHEVAVAMSTGDVPSTGFFLRLRGFDGRFPGAVTL